MTYPTHLPLDSRPASAALKITKASALPRGTCRALWVGTAGTLNFTDADGNVATSFPAKEGVLPVAVASIEASGTADDIWALY